MFTDNFLFICKNNFKIMNPSDKKKNGILLIAIMSLKNLNVSTKI